MRKIKVKVMKNTYSNLVGYKGVACVCSFPDEWTAKAWLKEQVDQGHYLSSQSYVTLDDISPK
jgi:hypothetical protein